MDNAVWTLDGSLAVARAIQPMLKVLGYHVALAGGNLNKGYSEKDLDLVFLPLTNDKAPELEPLMALLRSLFGKTQDEEMADDGYVASHTPNPYTPFRCQRSFRNKGKRIDVFIA